MGENSVGRLKRNPTPRRGAPGCAVLITGPTANPVERAVRLGAMRYMQARRWNVASEFGETEYLEEWIANWRPRAALITYSDAATVARAAALVPIVAAMCYTGDLHVPSVDVDQAAVARAAAEHLIGLGLRRFAVIGIWKYPWAVARARAFERFIHDAGYYCNVCSGNELRPGNIEGMLSISASRPAICQWIKSLPKPVGIFACADRDGQQLANHCRTIGLRVPEDAAIIGVDNDELICETSEPPLSSVVINWQQIGYEGAVLAGKLAEGKHVEPIERLMAPAGVLVRQSSDLLAVDDPEVADALRVIRQHADRPLSISELLRKLPVNRRRLERRFRELVGRRMLQELRRVHVEQAKRLLISTELPMPEVAERSGLNNATKMAIAFREEIGQTPTAFRQKFRLRPESE